MRQRIDKPEPAHFSEYLVLPSHECQLDPWMASAHTCLHPHENGPCVVRGGINEACKEAAY